MTTDEAIARAEEELAIALSDCNDPTYDKKDHMNSRILYRLYYALTLSIIALARKR
jgi:hypothetical protein